MTSRPERSSGSSGSRRLSLGSGAWRTIVVVALVGATATEVEAQARRFPNGQVLPSERLIENHPAALSQRPVPVVLLRHDPYALPFYCHLINDDGSLGRVTYYSLHHTAYGDYPFSATKTGFTETRIKTAHKPDGLFNLFIEYVLKQARGDFDKARTIVSQARQHDARCFSEIAKSARISLTLLKQNLGLMFDEHGQWVVVRLAPQYVPQLITSYAGDVQLALQFARTAEFLYGAIETKLAERVEKAKQTQQPPRRDEPKRAPAQNRAKDSAPPLAPATPVTFKDAQAELADAMQKMREFCLTLANAKCG